MSDHKYKIGQLVNYLGRERASGVYQVTQLMPPEGEAFQYPLRMPTSPMSAIAALSACPGIACALPS